MLNDLILLSGIDIPFPAAQINIHQPSIKEISYIGEEAFFTGCELLNFSKDSLVSEDKIRLQSQSNFDIIMSIIRDKTNPSLKANATNALMVLVLLFPGYTIKPNIDSIVLTHSENNVTTKLDNSNYNEFQKIITQIFCLTKQKEEEYNPQGDLAKKIADKLKKGKQQRAALKNEADKKIAVLCRYASILAVGQKKDLNSIMQYTVYQLYDEFQRYELKSNYDLWVKQKLAGAQDLKEVESWMKDIHS